MPFTAHRKFVMAEQIQIEVLNWIDTLYKQTGSTVLNPKPYLFPKQRFQESCIVCDLWCI